MHSNYLLTMAATSTTNTTRPSSLSPQESVSTTTGTGGIGGIEMTTSHHHQQNLNEKSSPTLLLNNSNTTTTTLLPSVSTIHQINNNNNDGGNYNRALNFYHHHHQQHNPDDEDEDEDVAGDDDNSTTSTTTRIITLHSHNHNRCNNDNTILVHHENRHHHHQQQLAYHKNPSSILHDISAGLVDSSTPSTTTSSTTGTTVLINNNNSVITTTHNENMKILQLDSTTNLNHQQHHLHSQHMTQIQNGCQSTSGRGGALSSTIITHGNGNNSTLIVAPLITTTTSSTIDTSQQLSSLNNNILINSNRKYTISSRTIHSDDGQSDIGGINSNLNLNNNANKPNINNNNIYENNCHVVEMIDDEDDDDDGGHGDDEDDEVEQQRHDVIGEHLAKHNHVNTNHHNNNNSSSSNPGLCDNFNLNIHNNNNNNVNSKSSSISIITRGGDNILDRRMTPSTSNNLRSSSEGRAQQPTTSTATVLRIDNSRSPILADTSHILIGSVQMSADSVSSAGSSSIDYENNNNSKLADEPECYQDNTSSNSQQSGGGGSVNGGGGGGSTSGNGNGGGGGNGAGNGSNHSGTGNNNNHGNNGGCLGGLTGIVGGGNNNGINGSNNNSSYASLLPPPVGITGGNTQQGSGGGDQLDFKYLFEELCPVCGDKVSGYHYGLLTCESCKGFFKRTVQNKKVYTCVAERSCHIDKTQRKRCPFCRFQKCLEVGMKLEAVRADRMRGGRNKFGPMYKRDRARKLQMMRQRQLALQAIRTSMGTTADIKPGQLSPTGYQQQSYPSMTIKQEIQIPQVSSLTQSPDSSPSPIAIALGQVPSSAIIATSLSSGGGGGNGNNGNGGHGNSSLGSTNTTTVSGTSSGGTSSANCGQDSGSGSLQHSSDSKLCFDTGTNPSSTADSVSNVEPLRVSPMIREFVQSIDDREWQTQLFALLQKQSYNQVEVDLFELMCKVLDQNLFSQVDWARNTIFFKDLKVDDQMKLLQHSWSDMLVLDHLHQRIHNGLPDETQLNNGQVFNLLGLGLLGVPQLADYFNELQNKLTELKFDMGDYVCMKFLILLNPNVRGIVNKKTVLEGHENVQAALLDYTLTCYPSVTDKFSRLLNILPEIHAMATRGEEHLYGKHCAGSAPTQTLLMEMLHAKRKV